MAKYYTIDVAVTHRVYEIEAESLEEAEELAYDEFMRQEDNWDDVDYWLVEIEEDDEDA